MKIKIKQFAKEQRGISVYRLSKLLKYNQQTVYSWANGRTQPSYESMDRLCKILNCTLDDLFEVEKEV
jgi:transcriptional regulator with XRE-family HTH domain